jgi:lipopolysaccharide biosynthesis protein
LRALVFAHFDAQGVIDDYVLHALRCFRPDFDIICFSSTADLSVEQCRRAGIYADIVLQRPNVGYDFLSWREGFMALPNVDYEKIVFANDSCYGPCSDLSKFWNRVADLDADLWGASLNHQFRPHVQSNFMGFEHRLLESGFARRFWQSVEVEPDKFRLIMRFEVGLSAAVEKAGFRIGGVVDLGAIEQVVRERVLADNLLTIGNGAGLADAKKADEARRLILSDPCPNPTQLYWGEALRRGYPFVKVEVLRDNPLGANLTALRGKLRADNWYDIGLIDRHLERVSPRSAWLAEL